MGNISEQINLRISEKIECSPKIDYLIVSNPKIWNFITLKSLIRVQFLLRPSPKEGQWSPLSTYHQVPTNQQSTQYALTYSWAFSLELSLQLFHRVSEGLNPMGRTIHRRRRRRRHQTNRRVASNCTNWNFSNQSNSFKTIALSSVIPATSGWVGGR